ncbi:hypothetical protein [Bacillus altitudinis]|uniref:hypothetical protein n=1 Tax=Bacillus altitudinis TaxID=293387 RepID=UPI0020C53A90|nr:hypothetical protein [Bacillus altitudinis]
MLLVLSLTGNTIGQKIARFKTGGSVGKVPAQGTLAVVDDGEIVKTQLTCLKLWSCLEKQR